MRVCKRRASGRGERRRRSKSKGDKESDLVSSRCEVGIPGDLAARLSRRQNARSLFYAMEKSQTCEQREQRKRFMYNDNRQHSSSVTRRKGTLRLLFSLPPHPFLPLPLTFVLLDTLLPPMPPPPRLPHSFLTLTLGLAGGSSSAKCFAT